MTKHILKPLNYIFMMAEFEPVHHFEVFCEPIIVRVMGVDGMHTLLFVKCIYSFLYVA